MSITRRLNSSQQGFTIVEMMIATAILATILLLATILITNIGNLYYKGVNQSNTQDDVRSIVDQMSQDIKLNSGGVISSGTGYATSAGIPVYAYCVGSSERYTYILSNKLSNDGGADPLASPNNYAHVPVVIWRDNDSLTGSSGSPTAPMATYQPNPSNPPAGGCQPVNLADVNLASADTSGEELISANSRLTMLCVGTISATGDCVEDTTGPAYQLNVGVAYGDDDLFSNPGSPNLINFNTSCQGGVGDRFCATATLSTSVIQRQ